VSPVPGSPGISEHGVESPEPETEFHLADYIRVVTTRWPLVAIVTALALALSLLQYAVTPKEYRASTMIQIERRVSLPLKAVQDSWMDNWFNLEYYPTQYRLLTSRGLAERVVLDLGLQADPDFNPGAAARDASKASGTFTAADDEAAIGGLAGALQGGLEVNPVRTTQLVEISFRSRSPELAAKVANGFADAYIDWGIENRTRVAGKASTFFGAQIETLKQEIQDKENQLQAYSRRSDIVSVDPATNVTLKRLEALNQEYISAVSERINREARLNELSSATGDRAADVLADPLLAEQRSQLLEMERDYATKLNTYKPEWPAMIELKGKIEQAQRNLKTVAANALLQARDGARGEVQTLQRREQALIGQLNQIKAENRQLNSAAVEYNNLQVEISTRRTLLDELVRKQSETDVSSRLQATGESNVRIIDRALVPGGPFRPSLRRSVTMGIASGFFLGLGLVFLLHYMDRTLKSTEEVERLLGLPVLAVVPDISNESRSAGILGRYGYGYGYGYGQRSPTTASTAKAISRAAKVRKRGAADADVQIELLPHLRPRLAVAEAYRSLRTALLLSSARELKVIVVTSAVPSEGKTSTAGNLAVVLAQLGKKVLLVDGDLRKPRQHEVFRAANKVGLVSFLTHGAEADKIVFRCDIENLFLTPSGPIPPNPSELLSSERMAEFLAFVRRQFDIVIIDSAPTLAVTDGILIGAQSDGVVLCLRAGYVQRRDAKTCRDRLLQAEVKLLGVVLNRHQGIEGRYRSGYSGSYGYAEATVYGVEPSGSGAIGALGAQPGPAGGEGADAGPRPAKKRGVAAV
jgi:succinoglycan biosynthesis transport protein ExoP